MKFPILKGGHFELLKETAARYNGGAAGPHNLFTAVKLPVAKRAAERSDLVSSSQKKKGKLGGG